MEFSDELLDQQPVEERRRHQKAGKKASLPTEEAVRVKRGAVAYRGAVTAVTVAGEEVIIMAKNSRSLMIAHQKLTKFAEFRLGLVHKAVIMSASDVDLDDEL